MQFDAICMQTPPDSDFLPLPLATRSSQLATCSEWHVVVLGDAIISALACISMQIANALAEINFRFRAYSHCDPHGMGNGCQGMIIQGNSTLPQ